MRKNYFYLSCCLSIHLVFCQIASLAQEKDNGKGAENPAILYPFRSDVDGLVGYIDVTGRVVFKPQFDYWDFDTLRRKSHEGLAIVIKKVKYPEFTTVEYGYIGHKGSIVIKPQFKYASEFSEGLALISNGNLSGYVNEKGKMVIDTSNYLATGIFSEGLTWAKSNENRGVGYMDKTGRIVIKPQFDEAKDFSEGLAVVRIGHKYGYIDKTGRMVITPQFDEAREFSEGLAAVKSNDKYGFIGREGYLAIRYKFENVESFSNGLALVKVKDFKNYFYIDKRGDMAFRCTFTNARSFSGGLASVEVDKEYGYINTNGEFAIKAQFDQAEDFYGDLALVRIGGRSSLEHSPYSSEPDSQTIYYKYGYINKRGEVVFKWLMPRTFGLRVASTEPIRSSELTIVKVRVNSNPTGAKVYFIPLDIWEDDNSIINDNERLFSRLASKYTSNDYDVYSQVYIVVLELNGKKVKRQIDVNPYKTTVVEIDFNKEK